MVTTTQSFISDIPCPECGAPLEVDPQCRIGIEKPSHIAHPDSESLVTGVDGEVIEVGPAALCTGCHFCIRIE